MVSRAGVQIVYDGADLIYLGQLGAQLRTLVNSLMDLIISTKGE